MRTKRLLKLADLLDADAKNKKGIKFDLAEWGEVGDNGKPMSCGTTACGMGLAALSGAFRRQGLSYDRDKYFVDFRWNGRKVDGIRAAQRLFGITKREAEYLFMPNGFEREGAKAERALATRIRKFTKGEVIQPPFWVLPV